MTNPEREPDRPASATLTVTRRAFLDGHRRAAIAAMAGAGWLASLERGWGAGTESSRNT